MFDKQTSSDLDEIWSKYQARYDEDVARIWGRSVISVIFLFFFCFASLRVVLVGKMSPECVEQLMDGYLKFLSLFWCILSQFRAPELGEKVLCQLDKSMSTCAILDLAQNAL